MVAKAGSPGGAAGMGGAGGVGGGGAGGAAAVPIRCAAPVGFYQATVTEGPAAGGCNFNISYFPTNTVPIEMYWVEEISSDCTGAAMISADGCMKQWNIRCPFTNYSGDLRIEGRLEQVSSTRIEGTVTTNARPSGFNCSISAQVVLTQIAAPDGVSCRDDAACASGTCCRPDTSQSGKCSPSTIAACPGACDEVECGVAHNVDCGGCPGLAHCTEERTCEPACVGMDCGMDKGVSCGTCEGLTYCSPEQTCEPACVDMDCGTDKGLSCGSCEGRTYCSPQQKCEPACIEVECGIDSHGVDCGGCAEGEVCSDAACVEALCRPSAYHCIDNAVYRCATTGLARSLVDQCEPEEFCSTDGSCHADICVPGEAFCDGNRFTVCNAEGSGGAPEGEDCSESGLDCTRHGCGDVLGWEPSHANVEFVSRPGFAAGNFFAVDTDVVLTRVNALFSNLPPTTLTVFVHESATQQGTYSRIYERQVSLAGAGLLGVEDIAVQLRAGRFYLIGVAVADRESARRLPSGHPEATGFGTTIAGFFADTPPGESVDYAAAAAPELYYQYLRWVDLR